LGRAVALKVLDANGVDPEFHRRFFQEAAILAKLQSRHTVAIYDYGRDGDLYFIAMELIVGEPLDRVLSASGALPVHRVLQISQEICRSLREAHSQGVIHRDLKPANVMLTESEDGQELAKVLDFGLAKRLDGNPSEDTQTDTVPGSPKYMAPEVIRQHAVDGRADMYGVGVMLYQMLTGVVPFDYDNPMDILVAHLQTAPRPFAVVNPHVDVPEALEQLVMKCLAKSPEQRFANMHDMLDALRVVAMSLGLHGERSWAGVTIAPDPSASSGVRATATQSLRLKPTEGMAPGSSLERPMSRTARGAWIAGTLGTLVLAGLAFWAGSGKTDRKTQPLAGATQNSVAPSKPNPAPPSPAPAPSPAIVQPVQNDAVPDAPNMVITADEAAGARLPSVTLHVLSEPPGASVLVRGKWMGNTPATFEWRDALAVQGGQLQVVLKLDGYEPTILKRTIDAAELELSSALTPARAQVDLNALEARARAVEAATDAPPVLKIAPSVAEEETPETTQPAVDEEDTDLPGDSNPVTP
jgi:serine/threonine-protein kinase